MPYFLQYQCEYADDAVPFNTKAAAVADFEAAARELDGYGQRIEATLTFANSRETLQEYPDYVLSLGPRGGVRVDLA